jgi:hypothetical protein
MRIICASIVWLLPLFAFLLAACSAPAQTARLVASIEAPATAAPVILPTATQPPQTSPTVNPVHTLGQLAETNGLTMAR